METRAVRYKRVLSAIGWALVILWGLMQILGVFVTFLSLVLEMLPLPAILSDIIYELLYGGGYLATFMLPVLFLKIIFRRTGCVETPMELSPRVSPYLPLMVFATVGVCFAAAQINALLLEVIDYSAFTEGVIIGRNEPTAPHMAVLNFIVISVVPGFCEEFLFRGAVLGNLLPFGRGRAILISSLAFALMHQNPGQLLYTFVAGVALGMIYADTKSIWNCTVAHLLNNFIAVIQEIMYSRLGDTLEGNAAILILECAVYLLGAISLAVLTVCYFRRRQKARADGVFGRLLPTSDDALSVGMESGRGLPASVILYTALCVLQMLLLIGLALLAWVMA